jgi:hypothetical protein
VALGPERAEPHALPDDLRAFFAGLAQKLADDPELLAHDADNAFADRIDISRFEITYLTADDWKWTFDVAPDEVAALGAEGARRSLWVCSDTACGYRFGDETGRCPRCDESREERTAQGLGRLLADLFGEAEGAPAPAAPPPPKPPSSGADKLLMMLVQQGQVELEPGADRGRIAAGMDGLLATEQPPDEQAAALIDWLLDQAGVEEVYISDDDLSRLLEAW